MKECALCSLNKQIFAEYMQKIFIYARRFIYSWNMDILGALIHQNKDSASEIWLKAAELCGQFPSERNKGRNPAEYGHSICSWGMSQGLIPH